MENLVIKGASDTFFVPSVNFNSDSGFCIISGESYLENTVEFYSKLYDWMKEFFNSKKPITFDFKLTYYNTSSNKAILQLMNLLKDYEDSGNVVSATWHYNPSDEEMREEAEDFALDSGLELKIVGDL